MKRAKNNIAMKAILIIIAAFGIQFSTLVASNIGDEVIPTTPKNLFCPICPFLIPEIPLEATFVEIIEMESLSDLAPVVPMETTFDNDIELADNSLAPVTPKQASFDDGVILLIKQDSSFAPMVPTTADFNDKQ